MTGFNRSLREPQCRQRASRSAPRTRVWLLVLLIAATVFAAAQARAAEHLRIAAQKTGTLAWELDIIRAAGLDRQHDLALETTELASTEAGKIALKGGSADLIVTDWLWVGRERALGDNLVFYPYSSALGAVMAPANSNIRGIADLVGKKIGVAGGPLDKSWLLLRALARRSGVDLKTQAQIAYGAPPLLTQKALQGETDATLTFWNFCAELEGKGMSRVVAMEDVVKQLGARDRFFVATQQAKKILAESPAEWQRLAPRIGVDGADALEIYRRRYLEGIPRRPLADEAADAQALYRVLAEIGGAELVGPAQALDPGTFYSARPNE
jgi:NitT/TauT family transport system substrate-binding protein